MEMYNPVTNSFTYYTPTEIPKVKLDLPLLDNPIDLPWASRVTDDGVIISSKEDAPQQLEVEDIFSYTPTLTNTDNMIVSKNINLNITGHKQQAMNFFINKGLLPIHAAGIVGNLLLESNLNPTAVNPSSKAFGIALWLGDRKESLIKKYGETPTFELQLEFLWEELNTTEKSAYNHLLNTKSYEEATNSVMNRFERPSPREKAESISRRLNFAKELLS